MRFKGSLNTNVNMRKVLVLGAGHVCGPVIEYLNKDGSNCITVGKLPLVQESGSN